MELKETPKPKKSIFNAFLAKRSTKVEPHSFDERNGTRFNIDNILHEQSSSHDQRPLQTSVSANSTPIKRLYKIGKLNRLWHCHGSNLSLTSNHSIPSHFLRKTSHSTKKRIANTKDRHSHPISSTHDVFYVTDNSSNDDLIKRSKSLNPNQNQNHSNSTIVNHNNSLSMHQNFSIEQFDNDIPKMGLSKSQEQIIVNDIDENTLCDSKQRSPTSKSHDGNFSWNRDELDYPKGHSIAMSACRSRLREKLLPPGYINKIQQTNEKQISNEQQQNSSFSNISNNKGDRSSATEQRNARSYSCDILQNAKRSGRAESLAKNSLMAAQLINLIPTEVARERYFDLAFIQYMYKYYQCSKIHNLALKMIGWMLRQRIK